MRARPRVLALDGPALDPPAPVASIVRTLVRPREMSAAIDFWKASRASRVYFAKRQIHAGALAETVADVSGFVNVVVGAAVGLPPGGQVAVTFETSDDEGETWGDPTTLLFNSSGEQAYMLGEHDRLRASWSLTGPRADIAVGYVGANLALVFGSNLTLDGSTLSP
jgi:hypothetical protein